MQCEKSIGVATPVLLRLQNGKEAGGQVAFCKASSSNDKLWGLGIVLDKPGNFWGLNPCPKDWLTFEEDSAALLQHDKQDAQLNPKNPRGAPGITSVEAETMRVELREQMRKEMNAIVEGARAKFDEELQAQKKNTTRAEKLLQDAVNVRDSQTAAMQSFEEALDQKLTDETKNAIEQIEACMNKLKLDAQSDSEELVHRVRKEADDVDTRVQEVFSAELEKARKEIADATSSIGEASDKIYSNVQQRLNGDFEDKQEIIASSRNAITAEAARLREEVGNADDRITKLNELEAQLTNFSTRLDQSLSETTKQARTSLEQLLVELRNEQTGLARAEMENMLTPISERADSLIKEATESADLLTRERDETQVQMGSLKQAKEEMQVWLAQQTPDFQKNIETVLSDATVQAKTIVQKALSTIQDPLEKFSSEAKNKIEEFATLQHSQLGKGISRLREVLATLEQQAEDSLRVPLQVTYEIPTPKDLAPPEAPQPDVQENVEKPGARSQTTFAQKLSGLVRGRESK